MGTRPWAEVKADMTTIRRNDGYVSMDDVQRALEALGFARGTDRLDLERTALDAYSEVWEPSQKLHQDHVRALLHAIVACAELINNRFEGP
jgi:hypothetical protein